MVHIRHRVIIATTWEREKAEEVAKAVREMSGWEIPPPMCSVVNGYWTVFIPPDGSGSHWPVSEKGNQVREYFKSLVNNPNSYFEWVEVLYSDDDYRAEILDSPWKKTPNKE